MQVFFAPDINGEFHTLDERESRHTVRVLRMSRGEAIRLIDGRGNLYEGSIEDPNQKACLIRIREIHHNFEKRNYRLHIAISPLKNPDRFEWFLEKSVEIGLDEISPLICHNTEKKDIKTERLNNIIVSAMKQSLKAKLTILNHPVKFSDFIIQNHPGSCMIAHCHPAASRKGVNQTYKKGNDALILIGPEGDFTNDEVSEAIGKGYSEVHLGTSRLRTETAGVAACHSIYFLNQ